MKAADEISAALDELLDKLRKVAAWHGHLAAGLPPSKVREQHEAAAGIVEEAVAELQRLREGT